jgi:hypothetical protein
MLTSPDEIMCKLMRQFEKAQVENRGIEWKKRESGKADGFLNWNPMYEQQKADSIDFPSGLPCTSGR